MACTNDETMNCRAQDVAELLEVIYSMTAQVGFGRTVVSNIHAPVLSANLV
jgi:hypothetical protein